MTLDTNTPIAVIGLGYVGLPLAVGLAKHFPHVTGFDINAARVAALKDGHDSTGEIDDATLKASSVTVTDQLAEIEAAKIYIVTVPTPIDGDRKPDLTPLIKASETVGKVVKAGDIVVYESTVYPGLTEEECGPVLARVSGLTQGKDFKLGYSPERINPGDKVHTVENIVKVVAGEDAATTDLLAELYGTVIKAGIHKAPAINVAEAAKVIENTQRDINIALMNELALIFDTMGIRTKDVLEAAGTKWNFLPFTPGLVGGHCIGVDPYYLTTKAERMGYHPQVVLSGRRINDGMGAFVAQKLIKMLVAADKPVRRARVGILGVTFKENVPDIRNSRVPDIITELDTYGVVSLIHDPRADNAEVEHEYGLSLVEESELKDLDALILAVPHSDYLEAGLQKLLDAHKDLILIDIKSALNPADYAAHTYWSL